MISNAQSIADFNSSILSLSSPPRRNPNHSPQFSPTIRLRPPRPFAVAAHRRCHDADAEERSESPKIISSNRRNFLLVPSLALAAGILHSAGASRAEEKAPEPISQPPAASPVSAVSGDEERAKEKKDVESEIHSRVYDATAIGEPLAVGKDKGRVWEKLLGARVVYLGESEMVPDRSDQVIELEIVKSLQRRCLEQERTLSLALEAFPVNLQEQLDRFMDGRIDGEGLRSYTSHWPSERWQDYEPLLVYCRDNGIKLVACGTPLEVLRTVQAEGIRGLSKAQRKVYAPPAGSGFVSGITSIAGRSLIDRISSNQLTGFGPSSYLSAQARVVDDYAISQIIMQEIVNGGSTGMLVVITGASHVIHGSRGTGVPARISKKLQKKNQAIILLNPERQQIRREGEVPVADFLWYSAAKSCSRNCFDRAEIARVMNAAGRRREALPQDLQKGLDLGIVSPEMLQNFFDLEQYPVISELIHRFQGFRERLLADPKFLHRLAIEEAISITTTLLAQLERRKGRFWEEIDYVLTDTIRGSVVDFFTVWLPAPTLSFLTYADENSSPGSLELLKGLLGSIPDNAFQKNIAGRDWNLNHRIAAVLVGGLKLAGVGFISSIGAGVASDALYAVRGTLKPTSTPRGPRKRTPILKSAVVYSSFLGTSANLRYQIIAGLVEHRLSDYLLSYQNDPFLVNILSFVVRTINSYWGTQQWIDLARFTGIQKKKKDPVGQISDTPPEIAVLECSSVGQISDTPPEIAVLECSSTEGNSIDDSSSGESSTL